MTEQLKTEVQAFLNRYFQNTSIENTAFLKAIQERMLDFPDMDQQIIFLTELIQGADNIRKNAAERLSRQEFYKVTGKEML